MTILGAFMGFLLLSGAGMPVSAEANAPVAPVAPAIEVAMTAYNAVPSQTDGDPFTTASGAYSNPEVVAARSRDLKETLPFGTIIEIDGPTSEQHGCGFEVVSPILGYRVIADTMHERFTKRVDILFSTKANYELSDGRVVNASAVLGVCKGVAIRVVGHLDPSQMTKLPKTQAELAALVHGGKVNTVAFKI